MQSETKLINKCLKNNASAQYELYNQYAPLMYGVCLRFAKISLEADDILQEGFIKVFNKLHTFKHKGSLKGWIRRIIVNTAINYLKKNGIHYKEVDIENIAETTIVQDEVTSELSEQQLLKAVQVLPKGKRIIFNLYVYEEYKHKEIAELLNISINTSKSQLAKAKKILQNEIENIKTKHYESF